MTGFQLRNATNPLGEYRRVMTGCGDGSTDWLEIEWDAEIPPATSISIEVRTADNLPDLAAQAWIPVATDPPDASPGDVAAALEGAGVQSGQYLEVKFQLRSAARDASPRLMSFSVENSCGPGLE